MISKMKWKGNRHSKTISDLSTAADEALAVVLMENSAKEWMIIAKTGENVGTNSREKKYSSEKTERTGKYERMVACRNFKIQLHFQSCSEGTSW
jgi:hypothetical protein